MEVGTGVNVRIRNIIGAITLFLDIIRTKV